MASSQGALGVRVHSRMQFMERLWSDGVAAWHMRQHSHRHRARIADIYRRLCYGDKVIDGLLGYYSRRRNVCAQLQWWGYMDGALAAPVSGWRAGVYYGTIMHRIDATVLRFMPGFIKDPLKKVIGKLISVGRQGLSATAGKLTDTLTNRCALLACHNLDIPCCPAPARTS